MVFGSNPMTRRSFLTGVSSTPRVVRPERRNVVLLICEQLQHNAGSFAGGPARTPNLERFASEATFFRTACTTTALCSPARAALFTGRLGHRTGLDDNCNVWHSRLTGLDPGQPTLIEWARRAGYFIGYYGKWHLGRDGPILRGADRYPREGFDRVPSPPGKVDRRPDFGVTRKYYGAGARWAEKPEFYRTVAGRYEHTPAARLAAQAKAFLEDAGQIGRPFFLTVSFIAVHPPYAVPEPYNRMYDPDRIVLPGNLGDTFDGKPAYQRDVMWPFHDTAHLSEEEWRRLTAYYYGFVSLLDRACGDIFQALQATGLADSTLVAVVADHGDMVGAHGRFDKGPYAYDEVMRIPMLIRAPGFRAREVRRHVSLIDLNRTLTEWMGVRPEPPNVDSRSLLPLMERGDDGWSGPDEAFYRYEWYNGRWFGIRAIRTHEYKYCFNPAGVDELYDLRKDPAELKNILAETPRVPVARALQERLLAHLAEKEDATLHGKLKEYLDWLHAGGK